MTSGGIYGTVANVENDTIMLKVSVNAKIRVSKAAVAGARKEPGLTLKSG